MLDALLTKTRQAILGLLLTRPDERFHLREVARRTAIPVGTIQGELASLQDAGILTRTVSGNRTYYQASTACPIYPELRGLLLKTVGMAEVLQHALTPVAADIRWAFVYGSMASGQAGPGSDIDLMVVGDVDDVVLHDALAEAEETLGRPVNCMLLTAEELGRRRSEKGGFLQRVLAGPRIVVAGSADGLR